MAGGRPLQPLRRRARSPAPHYNHPCHICEPRVRSPSTYADSLQYTVCDIVLLSQIYYYRWTRPRQLTSPLVSGGDAPAPVASEETPLITSTQGAAEDRKATPITLRQLAVYGGALAFVLGTGAIAWAVDQQMHKGQRRAPPKEVFEWKSQVLGWISAVLYRELHVYAF